MKILVINGHKYYPFAQGRLNKTLFNKIIELISLDNDVKTTIIENGYNTDEEIEKFLWADIIIFQTPMNWFAVPYILKEYFDNVYRYGIFYEGSKNYGEGGLLKNKKYMYSITMNSPQYAFEQTDKFFDGRGLDEVIIALHKLQQYCGMEKIETFAVYDVVKNPDISLYLANLEKHIKKYILNINH